jgi:hypothetical protein
VWHVGSNGGERASPAPTACLDLDLRRKRQRREPLQQQQQEQQPWLQAMPFPNSPLPVHLQRKQQPQQFRHPVRTLRLRRRPGARSWSRVPTARQRGSEVLQILCLCVRQCVNGRERGGGGWGGGGGKEHPSARWRRRPRPPPPARRVRRVRHTPGLQTPQRTLAAATAIGSGFPLAEGEGSGQSRGGAAAEQSAPCNYGDHIIHVKRQWQRRCGQYALHAKPLRCARVALVMHWHLPGT